MASPWAVWSMFRLELVDWSVLPNLLPTWLGMWGTTTEPQLPGVALLARVSHCLPGCRIACPGVAFVRRP